MISPIYQETRIVWKEVEQLLTHLESLCSEDEQRISLDGFAQEMQRLGRSTIRILEGIDKREELVVFHCRKDVDITVAKHEEYHKIQEQILADLQTYFQVIKASLNHFVILFDIFIPQSEVRGLRSRSFGSLVKSSKNAKTDNNKIGQILKILSTKGEYIDGIILEYRDKYVEHPRKLQVKNLTFDTSGDTSIIHAIKFPQSSPPDHSIIVLEKGIYISKLIIGLDNSEDFYVYLHIYSNLKSGDRAHKNKPIGEVFDNTVDHFIRYGPHFHIFSTPNAVISHGVAMGIEEKDIIRSPEFLESMLVLGNFFKEILPIFISYLT